MRLREEWRRMPPGRARAAKLELAEVLAFEREG